MARTMGDNPPPQLVLSARGLWACCEPPPKTPHTLRGLEAETKAWVVAPTPLVALLDLLEKGPGEVWEGLTDF